MKRVAVVFDGSGVLYAPIRVIKDIEKNKLESINFSGISLVTTRLRRGAMLIIRTFPRETIMKEKDAVVLSDFLRKEKIEVKIVYKADERTEDEKIKKPVLEDRKVTIGDVKETVQFLDMNFSGLMPGIGCGLIVEAESKEMGIKYVITSSGYIFPEVRDVISSLRSKGVSVFITSGDKIERTKLTYDLFGVPLENVYGFSSPSDKRKIVEKVRRDHDIVLMVGDDMNDIPAMEAADIAVISLEGGSTIHLEELLGVADFTVKNIKEVEEIVAWATKETRI